MEAYPLLVAQPRIVGAALRHLVFESALQSAHRRRMFVGLLMTQRDYVCLTATTRDGCDGEDKFLKFVNKNGPQSI